MVVSFDIVLLQLILMKTHFLQHIFLPYPADDNALSGYHEIVDGIPVVKFTVRIPPS